MKEKFVDHKFKAASLEQIGVANEIIADYRAQGLRLTLRQLYYQFVAHHGLPNHDKSYKRLAQLVSDARLAGLVDWDAIEDRGRVPWRPGSWRSPAQIVSACADQFRMDRWRHQPKVVELWVEKQALAGVLEPIADEHHIVLSVNKGYSSSSAMYEAAKRLSRASRPSADEDIDVDVKTCHVLYLGDHDPSGEDMVRDITERLNMFRDRGVPEIEVTKVALTMEQVEEHEPPPNPAKVTDSRFEAYREKYGEESWEVDALDPSTLRELIDDEIAKHIDSRALAGVKRDELAAKAVLRDAASKMR